MPVPTSGYTATDLVLRVWCDDESLSICISTSLVLEGSYPEQFSDTCLNAIASAMESDLLSRHPGSSLSRRYEWSGRKTASTL